MFAVRLGHGLVRARFCFQISAAMVFCRIMVRFGCGIRVRARLGLGLGFWLSSRRKGSVEMSDKGYLPLCRQMEK